MHPQSIISQLKDIHRPPPVSWWPPAAGWWILLLSIVALVIALAIYLRKRHSRNRYRREALQLIEELREEHHKNSDGKGYLEAVLGVLRRTARQMAPQSGIELTAGASAFIGAISQYAPKLTVDRTLTDNLDLWLYSTTPIGERELEVFHEWSVNWVKLHRPGRR